MVTRQQIKATHSLFFFLFSIQFCTELVAHISLPILIKHSTDVLANISNEYINNSQVQFGNETSIPYLEPPHIILQSFFSNLSLLWY